MLAVLVSNCPDSWAALLEMLAPMSNLNIQASSGQSQSKGWIKEDVSCCVYSASMNLQTKVLQLWGSLEELSWESGLGVAGFLS